MRKWQRRRHEECISILVLPTMGMISSPSTRAPQALAQPADATCLSLTFRKSLSKKSSGFSVTALSKLCSGKQPVADRDLHHDLDRTNLVAGLQETDLQVLDVRREGRVFDWMAAIRRTGGMRATECIRAAFGRTEVFNLPSPETISDSTLASTQHQYPLHLFIHRRYHCSIGTLMSVLSIRPNICARTEHPRNMLTRAGPKVNVADAELLQ